MQNTTYAILICTCAGLSTVLGGVLALYIKVDNYDVLQKLLAVSSGIIVGISILCLVPEGYNMLQLEINKNFSIIILGLSIFLGIIISKFIDSLFYENGNTFDNKHIFKTGIFIMLGLMIHNFPEGVITFVTTLQDSSVGTVVAISIIMHNIPEGIAIALPIYFATKSKKKAIFYSFIGGVAEPLGAVLANFFIKGTVNNFFIGVITYIVAGFMLDMGINSIFNKNCNKLGRIKGVLYFLLGLFIMTFIILFVNSN